MTPLRKRMLEDMRIRNFSDRTQEQYVIYTSVFAKHFGKSPEKLGPDEIRSFQIHMLEERKVSPETLNVAVLGVTVPLRCNAETGLGYPRHSLCSQAKEASHRP